MKRVLFTCLIFLQLSAAFAQSEAGKFKDEILHRKNLSKVDLKGELIKHDFSNLFTHTDNSVVYGFIGDNYQRLRIKFIRITKDTLSPDTYHVYGKSMVKNKIDEFKGTMIISNILKLKVMAYGVDDEYKNKGIKGEYIIFANYTFSENKNQPHSGVFKGVCKSDFYLDKNNKVCYDDIELDDSYTNNQFVGQWTSYDGKSRKRCNWGDFRIPNSGDFDIGAGDFSPDDKYLKYGWQTVRDLGVPNQNSKRAKKIEEAKWWK